MALTPGDPLVYVQYGEILTSVGRPEEAIPVLQKAIRLNPFCPASYYNLFGGALRMTGRFEEAVSAHKKALQRSPDSIWAHSGLASTYFYAGRPAEAIPLLQKAIQLSPSGPFFLYGLFGSALRDTERFEEAVSAYKKAIQLAPDDIIAHIGLAATYSYMGRESEAQAEAIEVLRINPKFSLDSYAKTLPPFKDQSQRDKYLNALRKAGLK